jgi:CheY-like chemotaxis protein
MASILFLDGNHALRSVFAGYLRNDGYTVLEAADMAQAERACKEYKSFTSADVSEKRDCSACEDRSLDGPQNSSLTTHWPSPFATRLLAPDTSDRWRIQ